MLLTQLHIKNFRCFSDVTFHIDSPLVVIEGLNGSGKTSLLEAAHYLCYLRSFRTHSPRELLASGHDTFFIKAIFNPSAFDHIHHELQIGFSGKKRLVKINQKPISSYKELMDYYRIVTLTEDDLALIHGNPDVRRFFIDQAIVLYQPEFSATLRAYRHIVEHRNKLLSLGGFDAESYNLWTEQLWHASRDIQNIRFQVLAELERETNAILATYFDASLTVAFEYKPKRIGLEVTFEEFMAGGGLAQEERRYGHSLFGAHLDDFTIKFQDKRSKSFSSRGQQKLVILLIKIAQIRELLAKKGPAIFLLDDFMTDFDAERAGRLCDVLMDLKIQLIFTSPTSPNFLGERLLLQGAQKIKLTY